MTKIIAICLALALSGCAISPSGASWLFGADSPFGANSPVAISNMSSEELRSVDIKVLCSAYAHPWFQKEKIRTELRHRNVKRVKDSNVQGGHKVIGTPVFTEREWQAIDGHHVFIGMSEAALICSWGLPGSCGGISHSHRGPTQYAYQGCDGDSSDFVYVEDNTVVDWSTEQ